MSFLLLPTAAANAEEMGEALVKNIARDIQTAFEGLAQAAQALDHEAYLGFFDPKSFSSLNADGTVFHSREAFQSHYEAGVSALARYHSLTFRNVKIDVIDAHTAILVNEYEAAIELQSGEIVTARGAGTQVWSKRTGDWKLVSISSSAKP